MPYEDEPTPEDFILETETLHLRLIDESDVLEVYALLNDQRLRFLDPAFVPHSEDALLEHVRKIRTREYNNENYRLYQWVARSKETGDLVAVVAGELYCEKRSDRIGEDAEIRVIETSTYVHPDHQRLGYRYGRRARRRIQHFAAERFLVTVTQARIRWDNEKAQALVAAEGMVKLGEGMTSHGYQTWRGVIPPGDV